VIATTCAGQLDDFHDARQLRSLARNSWQPTVDGQQEDEQVAGQGILREQVPHQHRQSNRILRSLHCFSANEQSHAGRAGSAPRVQAQHRMPCSSNRGGQAAQRGLAESRGTGTTKPHRIATSMAVAASLISMNVLRQRRDPRAINCRGQAAVRTAAESKIWRTVASRHRTFDDGFKYNDRVKSRLLGIRDVRCDDQRSERDGFREAAVPGGRSLGKTQPYGGEGGQLVMVPAARTPSAPLLTRGVTAAFSAWISARDRPGGTGRRADCSRVSEGKLAAQNGHRSSVTLT
jgi:hypothetical protein